MRTVVVTEQDREALILAIKQTPLDGQHPYVCSWEREVVDEVVDEERSTSRLPGW